MPKHTRLRPKPSMKNKKKITQDDKDYLEWFANQELPCFVCGTYYGIEGHHIKNSSVDKKIHTEILPLCSNHHRGNIGLSAHMTPKEFRKLYPVEVQREYAKEIHDRYLKEMK